MGMFQWKSTSLLREIEKLRQCNEELTRLLAEANHQLAEADKKIADLERKLEQANRDSTNSSKPPSSDGLRAEKRVHPQRIKGKRKPGGQPGHPGSYRRLLPTEQVQQVVPLRPSSCSQCGTKFHGQEPGEIILRHQVTDLPPVLAEVTEFQCWQVDCPLCGTPNRGELPAEHRSAFGPRLIAWIAWLTVQGRMPRRVLEAMLETMLQVPISLGRIQGSVDEASTAVAPVYQELQGELPRQKVLNVDETGWKTSGNRRWMWAFVAARYVFYWLDPSRGKKVLELLLGEAFAGVLCTDRWTVYLAYHRGNAQLCWAHLKRDLLGVLETSHNEEAILFARQSLALVLRLFRLWHRYQGNSLDREELQDRALKIEKRFFRWADEHVNSKCAAVRCLARVFFLQTEKLFEFVHQTGVEPTNNRAERALRMAVQWRKICFGNRSGEGEKATSRLLTVIQTCKMQSRNSFQYMVETIVCHRKNLPSPSLLS
jgi:transposase